MDHLPDNFASYPETLGERRAEKSDGNAALWTPRDALISLLRDIDGGKVKPTGLVIAFFEERECGHGEFGYRNACRSPMETLGTLEMAKHRFCGDG